MNPILISPIDWTNLPSSVLGQDANLRDQWDRLNSAHGNLPFLSTDAIVSALENFGSGKERLLVGRDGASVVAMFVLTPKGIFRWQTFQPSQLPLGAWVLHKDIPLATVGRSLMRGPLDYCLVLSFTQIDPRLTPREEDSDDNLHSDYIETGWIDVCRNFDEYWSARGKNLRQNMRKQRTRLLAEGIKTQFKVLRAYSDIAQAIAEYGRLESAGWKGSQGTAIHSDNNQGRFYRDLLEHASTRQEAVIYQYLFDDRTVAMDLCLERAGVLVVLKTTYDESIKTYSPAFLLRQDQMEEVHNRGIVRTVEYYGRLMDWHTKWTDTKRTLYHLTVYRWPRIKRFARLRRTGPKE